MKKFFFSFAILFFLIRFPVQADFLPSGKKSIGSLIDLQGWENVEDYIIVQPIFGDWGDYDEEVSFYLLKDEQECFFGSEGHCAFYYFPMAIKREYLSDIKYTPEIESEFYNHYTLSCDTRAYKTAIATDVEIPHTSDLVVDEDNPLIRKDYIVTFQGVDEVNKKLLIDVSEPILQYENQQEKADEFENSLDNTTSLNYNNPELVTMESWYQNLLKEEKKKSGQYLKEIKKLKTKNNQIDIQPTPEKDNEEVVPEGSGKGEARIDWVVASYLSATSIGLLIGFLLGKRKKNGQLRATSE